MDSVVAIETFTTNASKRGDDHGLCESELVFNGGMDGGVALYAGHPNSMPSMVVLDKYHALLLIEV